MGWINRDKDSLDLRRTSYNNSVCMHWYSLESMMALFDTIFDSISNFTDQISSLTLYPFRIKPQYYNDTTTQYYLEVGDNLYENSPAYRIDFDNYYLTLGEYKVEPYFHNFADYKGYTQLKVFLPLMGYVDLDVNECMGKYLQFRLIVDYYSGKGTYVIATSNTTITQENAPYADPSIDSSSTSFRIIATFETNIGVDIPIGRSSAGDIKRNLLLGTVKTIASMGFSAYTGSLPPSTSTTTYTDTAIASARGDYKGARMIPRSMTESSGTKKTTHHKTIDKSRPIEEAIDGSIETLNRLTLTGNTDRVNDSMLMWRLSGKIKVVIIRPKILPIDSTYNHLYGEPLGEVKALNEIYGYTEVSRIHFEGTSFGTCTLEEMSMIEQAFTNGVILPPPPATE